MVKSIFEHLTFTFLCAQLHEYANLYPSCSNRMWFTSQLNCNQKKCKKTWKNILAVFKLEFSVYHHVESYDVFQLPLLST